MTKQQARLRVRLYARLSKDDGDADKESNSITNQLQMLRYYRFIRQPVFRLDRRNLMTNTWFMRRLICRKRSMNAK